MFLSIRCITSSTKPGIVENCLLLQESIIIKRLTVDTATEAKAFHSLVSSSSEKWC
jgi:hypothetical protein